MRAFGLWVGLGVLVALFGCESDARLRAEARRFSALHAAIPYGGDAATRERGIRALEQAAFTEDLVKHTRDMCVAGHRALLAEERTQEANASEIDRALAAQPGGEPLPPETVARLKAKLADSESQLARARDTLRECEAGARSLELRFGKR